MTTQSADPAPEAKRYKYYGIEYKMSVGQGVRVPSRSDGLA